MGTGIVFGAPDVSVIDVDVRAADFRAMHLDQHMVVADAGIGNVLEPDAGFGFSLSQGFDATSFT
jgi:hypothetical protein